MVTPNSTVSSPIPADGKTPAGREAGCGGSKGMARRTKWIVAVSAALVVAAIVLGSAWLGFAAVLPFLYLLPCLAMTAMCLKGMKNQASGDTSR